MTFSWLKPRRAACLRGDLQHSKEQPNSRIPFSGRSMFQVLESLVFCFIHCVFFALKRALRYVGLKGFFFVFLGLALGSCLFFLWASKSYSWAVLPFLLISDPLSRRPCRPWRPVDFFRFGTPKK